MEEPPRKRGESLKTSEKEEVSSRLGPYLVDRVYAEDLFAAQACLLSYAAWRSLEGFEESCIAVQALCGACGQLSSTVGVASVSFAFNFSLQRPLSGSCISDVSLMHEYVAGFVVLKDRFGRLVSRSALARETGTTVSVPAPNAFAEPCMSLPSASPSAVSDQSQIFRSYRRPAVGPETKGGICSAYLGRTGAGTLQAASGAAPRVSEECQGPGALRLRVLPCSASCSKWAPLQPWEVSATLRLIQAYAVAQPEAGAKMPGEPTASRLFVQRTAVWHRHGVEVRFSVVSEKLRGPGGGRTTLMATSGPHCRPLISRCLYLHVLVFDWWLRCLNLDSGNVASFILYTPHFYSELGCSLVQARHATGLRPTLLHQIYSGFACCDHAFSRACLPVLSFSEKIGEL